MRSDIMEQAIALKVKMDENQKIVDTVEAAGGITVTVEQSDKLGFNWRIFAVNGIVVRKDYEEQEKPIGTADNPIAWVPDARLIPNGFYSYGGEVKVWTGESGVSAEWNDAAWEKMT